MIKYINTDTRRNGIFLESFRGSLHKKNLIYSTNATHAHRHDWLRVCEPASRCGLKKRNEKKNPPFFSAEKKRVLFLLAFFKNSISQHNVTCTTPSTCKLNGKPRGRQSYKWRCATLLVLDARTVALPLAPSAGGGTRRTK